MVVSIDFTNFLPIASLFNHFGIQSIQDSFLIFFYESIFLILLLRFVSRARFLWKRNLEFLEAVVTPGGGGS